MTLPTTTPVQQTERERLLSIGGQMANVLYNWSQEANAVGGILKPEERDLLKRLQTQWDQAARALSPVQAERREAMNPADQMSTDPKTIIDVLTAWETQNGSLCGVLPDEWAALMPAVSNAAVYQSPRQAADAIKRLRAAAAALHELMECEEVRYNLRSGKDERVYEEFRARNAAAWAAARASTTEGKT